MRSGSNHLQPFLSRLTLIIAFATATGFFLHLLALPVAAQAPTPTDAPTRSPAPTRPATESMNPDSWILIEELPEDAAQADFGEQYYIFVCQSCHGDEGRGLTAEWISKWAPNDQNCWQTKCHASSHPPDGFTIPYTVPPVVGEDTLLNFRTAFDLYNYIRHAMPYQAPGTMLDEEYWAVTAYLMRENQMGDLSEPLSPDNAVSMALRPGDAVFASPLTTEPPAAEPTAVPGDLTGSLDNAWPFLGGGLIVLLASGFLAWRLFSRRSSP